MKNRAKTFLFVVPLLTALLGCSGAVKYPDYYTLHLPPAPDPPAAEGVHTSLAIREFRSPAYLRQGAIVYKTSAEQIGFYNYHRWAVDPRDFLTNAVAERLRASGNFATVKVYDGRSYVAYVLTGRLEKLEEIDYEGGVKVEVAISAEMTKFATGETVWTNAVSEMGTVGSRNVPAIVEAMSDTMERAITKLLTPVPNPTTK